MAIDDQYEIVFPAFKGRCHGNQFLLVLSTELIFVTPLASGAAGRANVGLCLASSFYHDKHSTSVHSEVLILSVCLSVRLVKKTESTIKRSAVFHFHDF